MLVNQNQNHRQRPKPKPSPAMVLQCDYILTTGSGDGITTPAKVVLNGDSDAPLVVLGFVNNGTAGKLDLPLLSSSLCVTSCNNSSY